jgi:hypothetical protein
MGMTKNKPMQYTIANHLYSAVVSPSNRASLIGTLLSKGIGYQINIPVTLKSEWHNAICSEYFSVFAGPLILAKIPVTVVPIFEPMVKGNTRSSVTKPMPTNGVSVDVKTELDWTIIVKMQPSLKLNSYKGY